MTYDEAEDAASRHRAQYGDDVILHSPDDEGSFFACEDCDWLCVYDPEPDWDSMDAAVCGERWDIPASAAGFVGVARMGPCDLSAAHTGTHHEEQS